MPIPQAVRAYLKEHNLKYRSIYHTSAYTAQQLAHAQHVTGEKVLKVVLLKSEEGYFLAILPATYRVDFSLLKRLTGKKEIRLGTESEIRQLFPDCEIGALPPFSDLYHLPIYADESLKDGDEVLIVAGTHRDAIQMKYEALATCVRPTVGKFAVHL